jgi:hypothetical protein
LICGHSSHEQSKKKNMSIGDLSATSCSEKQKMSILG